MKKKRIAIVVQRAGLDLVGGAEEYALTLARVLSGVSNVDMLTTTARDPFTWKNEYAEGEEPLSDSLSIKRFKVDFERGDYWWKLNSILQKNTPLASFLSLDQSARKELSDHLRSLPLGLCEEWIKHQGPYSSSLLTYMEENSHKYEMVFFVTYLYATTYYGIEKIPDKEKIRIIPTYHDEPAAYLPVFAKYGDYVNLFLTGNEKRIAEQNIYEKTLIDGAVIGYGLKDRFEEIASASEDRPVEKYILYAGRLEKGKGVLDLFHLFDRYYSENKKIKLFTIGKGELQNFSHAGVVYKGFVSEDEKLRLMKNAVAFVHPSSLESLGIVLLESFMMGTPGIINGKSNVLKEHIDNSNAGFYYMDYDEFSISLDRLVNDHALYVKMSERARRYFLRMYSMDSYRRGLLRIIE